MKSLTRVHPGRVRVLFFDHIAALSGGEIALANLIEYLDVHEVEPIVVLGEDGPLVDRLRGLAEVHILPVRSDLRDARKDSLGARSVRADVLFSAIAYVYRLARFLRKNRVELVHTNSLKADILGGIAARLARTPVIWHVRDRISPDYLPAKVVILFRHLSRWLPTALIANSYSTASTLELGASPRLHVVHDGTVMPVPVSRSLSLIDGEVPSSPEIGLVGRISPWKGQDVFARAASIVRIRFPDARFKIIGAALFGELEYEKGLHALAESLGIGEALVFTGFCRDVQDAIAGLDILVHASTRPEPFGQVVIEGMAAAKPVIAIDAGGVPEIVVDGVNGLLVRVNDPEAMAAAIMRLIENPEIAREMGRRAREHVEQNFSMTKTAAGVLDVYRSVLGDR